MSDEQQTIVPGGSADLGSRISRSLSIYGSAPIAFLAMSALSFPLALIAGLWEWGILLAIPNIFIGEIVAASISHGVYTSVMGRPVGFRSSMTVALQSVGQLFEYTLRLAGAVLLLCITIVGIPFAIRLFVRWQFGTQAVVLYGDSAKDAISRSVRLTTDNWWRTFGNVMVAGILTGSVGIGLAFIPGPIGGVGSAVWGTLAAPFFSIFVTLLFLRLAKEKDEPPPPIPVAP